MLSKRIFALLLAFCLLLPQAAAANGHASKDGLRGVWVSSVYNIDYPSRQGLTADELKREADTVLDNCLQMGLNAVFLQVRPSADALYRSNLFPWSRYVSGVTGQAPDGDFDVLAYWVEAAHARGLQLHAWLNPYRITRGGEEEWNALPETSPAKQHPEWVVVHEGNYYFDPGLPSVQQLVVDGALEIVRRYEVDGIHLDDYFYPSPSFQDAATYARYGEDFDDIGDWRRDNVNRLIASLDEALHAVDPDLSFGVSPAGIWDNKSSNPKGSDTQGRSSYREIFCDSVEWVRAGTVDYICPQIYWSIGYKIADFEILLDWWQDIVSTSDVALYIGLGAYRAAEAAPGDTWYGTAELQRQLDMIEDSIDVQGEVFFSYSSLMEVNGCASMLAQHYTEIDGVAPGAVPQDPAQSTATFLGIFTQFLTSLFAA